MFSLLYELVKTRLDAWEHEEVAGHIKLGRESFRLKYERLYYTKILPMVNVNSTFTAIDEQSSLGTVLSTD